MDLNESAIKWLLNSDDPSIRYFTLVDLLDAPGDSLEVQEARRNIPNGRRLQALMQGQRPEGGFGVSPYTKWAGAHWRLVSLVELGVPRDDPRVRAAAETVLQWLTSDNHQREINTVNGLTRAHASQEGNALAVCSRLGLARDQRVKLLAHLLVEWQWPDGGWNCDKREQAHRSSFYESLATLWGLIEYHRATGDAFCLGAAERATDFFLRHRMFCSERTGEVIRKEWLNLHYPLYWHYDILQGLRIVGMLGKLSDPRAGEALNILEQKQLPDGLWRPVGYYWNLPGKKGMPQEVVDWGRSGPNEMITLNALRVLKQAGEAEFQSSLNRKSLTT
jgi:hypothetical protein